MDGESESKPLLQEDDLNDGYYSIQKSEEKAPVSPAESEDDKIAYCKPTHRQDAEEQHIYALRWYILLSYSAVNMAQNFAWNTYSPISKPAERVYGWKEWHLATIANMGPFAYFVAVFPFSWLMDVKGLRPAVVSTAFLVAAGTGLRCFLFSPSIYSTGLVFAGAFLNGLAGPVAMAAPPLLSAVWFPVNERTTATSISSQLAYVGLAGSFLIGPYMVEDTSAPATYHLNSSVPHCPYNNSMKYVTHNVTYCADVDYERQHMKYFMFGEFGVSAMFFLLVLLYFPNKPKSPPSTSATVERLDFGSGIKHLARNVQFWLILLTYGITSGVYNAWLSVLDVNMAPLGVSEVDAGWIGFLMQLVPAFISILVARGVDYFASNVKWVVLVLCLVSTAFFTVFLLVVIKVIHVSLVMMYVLLVSGAIFLQPTIPLFFEMSVECSYPVSEGITTGVLTLANNAMAALFLLVPLIPNIGTSWMDYLVVGSIVLCMPIIGAMKETRGRAELDRAAVTQTQTPSPHAAT